ncbi:unnamed protein product [Pedinophyceae sp. YPF-701]|nr:unnamed protein product [Pedinophyceae sp. YPF-701]
MADPGPSVIEVIGPQRSSCGYCSGRKTSRTFGCWAVRLTVYDYQALIDRGWRRSGSYIYKPVMRRTCCPQYTIRLRASDFVPSKEQRRVQRRWDAFLRGERSAGRTDAAPPHSPSPRKQPQRPAASASDAAALADALRHAIAAVVAAGSLPPCEYRPPALKPPRVGKKAAGAALCAPVGPALVAQARKADPSVAASAESVAAAVAAELSTRLAATSMQRAEAAGGFVNLFTAPGPAGAAAGDARAAGEGPHGGQACGGAAEGAAHAQREGETGGGASERPERSGGGVQAGKRKQAEPQRLAGASGREQQLEVTLVPSRFDEEEYQLYKRYQMAVHGDSESECGRSQYKRFLCTAPFAHVPPTADPQAPACGFGAFHQQYRVDGQLVAVGVVDVLPRCLSSKYFFWDPDLASLSLGKVGALTEIQWVRDAAAGLPRDSPLQYYYLGYYIHSCPKMKYKADYSPSELLDPFEYTWHRYDAVRPLLDARAGRFVPLSDALRGGSDAGGAGAAPQTDGDDEDPGREGWAGEEGSILRQVVSLASNKVHMPLEALAKQFQLSGEGVQGGGGVVEALSGVVREWQAWAGPAGVSMALCLG